MYKGSLPTILPMAYLSIRCMPWSWYIISCVTQSEITVGASSTQLTYCVASYLFYTPHSFKSTGRPGWSGNHQGLSSFRGRLCLPTACRGGQALVPTKGMCYISLASVPRRSLTAPYCHAGCMYVCCMCCVYVPYLIHVAMSRHRNKSLGAPIY
ncbi:hypothetical protein F4818DRAFT_316658 [Hypoxylon cercidicola]|nr:hypothetical protein F4818DRAFT_316658 [Hypoxylon cercidicola]